uniref:COMM domain containing 7 n=1 Tax=Anser brachyrhynchus TaxID=132585 RepID=A0A8B9CUH2_9AVES
APSLSRSKAAEAAGSPQCCSFVCPGFGCGAEATAPGYPGGCSLPRAAAPGDREPGSVPSATSLHRADAAGGRGVTRGDPWALGCQPWVQGWTQGERHRGAGRDPGQWGNTTKGPKWARGARPGCGGPEAPGLDLVGETREGGEARAAQGRQHPAAGAWLGVLGTPRCGGVPGGARSRGPGSGRAGPGGGAESAAANAQAEAGAGGGAGPGRAGGAAAAMGLLNFTRDPVPEAVSGDMHNLNQLSAEQFSALTEVLFRFLTGPKEVERFLTQLSDFATMNKISLGPLKNIVKSILLVPNGALKRNLSSEQVRADFIALGLSEEKATYFAEQWKLNSPTLTRLAVGQTLMINQLIDMEWKFGVTAGSSELEKVGSIFLQLKLVIKKGTQMENVYIELTLPQFYSFLHEMERVKTSLESFS